MIILVWFLVGMIGGAMVYLIFPGPRRGGWLVSVVSLLIGGFLGIVGSLLTTLIGN